MPAAVGDVSRSSRLRENVTLLTALVVGLTAITLAAIGKVMASSQIAYAWGDGAVLELYTTYAARGAWYLGPYSQFTWNHPGPLLFYALLPVYKLSQSHTFGLNAGALVINLVSLIVAASTVTRWARPATACAILMAIGLFVFRVDSIILISYWNPHIIVLPLAAFVLLCAAVCAGHPAALPAAIAAGSFLTQTHVALVPVVAALVLVSLVGLFATRRLDSESMRVRPICRSIVASLCVLVVLWSLPLIEEATRQPGNLTKLLRFFTESYESQPWFITTSAWGDSIAALLVRPIEVPGGAQLRTTGDYRWIVLSSVQVLILIAGAWDARRRGDSFLFAVSVIGAAASAISLWSISRIRYFVGDYMVFWVVIVGALNWGSVGAIVMTWCHARLPQLGRAPRGVAATAAMVLITAVAIRAGARLWTYTRVPQEGPAKTVAVLTPDLQRRLRNSAKTMRPLVCISRSVWAEGAGVVAGLYKEGITLSIEPQWVSFFGEPVTPTGNENSVVFIADSARNEQLARLSGIQPVASYDRVYVHLNSHVEGVNGAALCSP
jgi:hypothetical protein